MKKVLIISSIMIVLLLSSVVGKNIIKENKVNKSNYRESNLIDKGSSSSDLLELHNTDSKMINIYVDNNTISFDSSNTTTELSYPIYNKLLNSDKSKWSIMTNNLIEDYKYENNKIIINDDNITTISISFIYNNDQYNLSLIKEEDTYKLVESKIKVIHGELNSLWYTYVYDLNTAIKAANKNDYIIIYDDIDVNNTIKLNKSINILSNQGNRYTIKNTAKYLFNSSNKKLSLKIKNINIKTKSLLKGKGKVKLSHSKVIKSIK